MRFKLYFVSLLLFPLVVSSQDAGFTLQDEYRDQIRSLSVHPKMVKAMEYIKSLDAYTLDQHIALTEIEAPPYAEEERGLAFYNLMDDLGVDSIWIDEVGNVLALINGTKGERTVALDAHLDTVFPKGTDVKVRISNDTLYAPGIGDDTRALANLLTVLKTMNDIGVSAEDDILLVASVGEEGQGDLRGVKHIFRDGGPKIDAWISIDGGQIGRVNNKGLGSYRYRVTFHGPGGHSWGAFGLVNPHHALAHAMNLFVEFGDHFTSYGPRTSYNVGVIGGGTSINSIPFESYMEIDVRSESPSRLDTMEQKLYDAVHLAVYDQNKRKRLGEELTVTIDKIGNRPSGELSSDLPLIQRTIAATAYFGKRPTLTRGSTNSNIPISKGIPSVTIGRGGTSANAHSLDEWWYNADGHKAIQMALLLLIAEAGLAD